MTKIKFCGITNFDDAELAIDLGVDALGFNFFTGSPRYISPPDAQAIVRRLPASVWFVGVFVNAPKSEVDYTARQVGLDTLQFHGDEDLSYCEGWDEWRVIKAIRLSAETTLEEIRAFEERSEHLLFDRFEAGSYGGTGEAIPTELLDEIHSSGLLSNSLLSGGLTPENVASKVAQYEPFGVDVASGIEISPGKKGAEKMQAFVEALRAKSN